LLSVRTRRPDITALPYTTLFRSAMERERQPFLPGVEGELVEGERRGRVRRLAVGQDRLGHRTAIVEGHGLDVAAAEVDLVAAGRSEEHTSELQSREKIVCRLLLE